MRSSAESWSTCGICEEVACEICLPCRTEDTDAFSAIAGVTELSIFEVVFVGIVDGCTWLRLEISESVLGDAKFVSLISGLSIDPLCKINRIAFN